MDLKMDLKIINYSSSVFLQERFLRKRKLRKWDDKSIKNET